MKPLREAVLSLIILTLATATALTQVPIDCDPTTGCQPVLGGGAGSSSGGSGGGSGGSSVGNSSGGSGGGVSTGGGSGGAAAGPMPTCSCSSWTNQSGYAGCNGGEAMVGTGCVTTSPCNPYVCATTGPSSSPATHKKDGPRNVAAPRGGSPPAPSSPNETALDTGSQTPVSAGTPQPPSGGTLSGTNGNYIPPGGGTGYGPASAAAQGTANPTTPAQSNFTYYTDPLLGVVITNVSPNTKGCWPYSQYQALMAACEADQTQCSKLAGKGPCLWHCGSVYAGCLGGSYSSAGFGWPQGSLNASFGDYMRNAYNTSPKETDDCHNGDVANVIPPTGISDYIGQCTYSGVLETMTVCGTDNCQKGTDTQQLQEPKCQNKTCAAAAQAAGVDPSKLAATATPFGCSAVWQTSTCVPDPNALGAPQYEYKCFCQP